MTPVSLGAVVDKVTRLSTTPTRALRPPVLMLIGCFRLGAPSHTGTALPANPFVLPRTSFKLLATPPKVSDRPVFPAPHRK